MDFDDLLVYMYILLCNNEDIRKKYVKESIFASRDYEPSEVVFGAIQDNKPWYGLDYYYCAAYYTGKPEILSGPSEESRYINNPAMLVGYNCGGIMPNENYLNICRQRNLDMPRYLQATKIGETKARITAKHLLPKHGQICSLVGLNARDLGYNYIHAGSTSNIKFKNGPSAKTSVYSFKNYIHKGPSCGLEGGCNNGSPYQSEVAFDYIPKNYKIGTR